MGAHAEVLDGLTGVLGTSEQDDVAAGWVPQGELVEGQALTAGLLDPGAGSGCESQSGNVEFRHGQEAVVVRDGSDHSDGLVLVCLLCALGGDLAGDAGDGHWGAVDAGHEKSLEHNLVEVGVSSALKGGKKGQHVDSSSSFEQDFSIENVRARKRYSFTKSLR